MGGINHLTVRVPATTSNLGPGFDTVGLALNLYTDYTVRVLEEGGPNRVEGRVGSERIRLKDFPFFPLFERIFALVGRPAPAVAVKVAGEAPLGVGLGWSGGARVAGALAANAILGCPLTSEFLLTPLVEAEGHPDNISPCLFGGLTASVMTAEGPLVHVYQPAELWRLALLVPDYTLPTDEARKALPAKVPLVDAVFNLQRVPFLLDALVAGDAGELSKILGDRLHERHRGEMIKRYSKLCRAAREAGAAAVFISGAGPALAAFCTSDAQAAQVRDAMLKVTEGAKFMARGYILRPEPSGARVAEMD